VVEWAAWVVWATWVCDDKIIPQLIAEARFIRASAFLGTERLVLRTTHESEVVWTQGTLVSLVRASVISLKFHAFVFSGPLLLGTAPKPIRPIVNGRPDPGDQQEPTMSHQPPKENKKKAQHTAKEKKSIKQQKKHAGDQVPFIKQ
jgi:hypothetical protein